MANNYVFPEWLVANAVRAFPLAQDQSRIDLSGNIKIPDSLIVDAAINSLPDYITGIFYISSLTVTAEEVDVEISFAPQTGDARIICRIATHFLTHEENTSYPILGTDEDASVTGSITIGDTSQARSEIAGSFYFGPENSAFEPSRIFVSVPAVKYVAVFSGSTLIGHFDSILRLRSGRNIRLRYVDDDTIAIDAVDGLNTSAPDSCGEFPAIGPAIKTINGIPPDESGNFTLDGSDCIELDAIDGGIAITDACSKSCCGCTELESLIAAQQQVESQLTVLKAQISAIQNNQTAMIVDLVSSLNN